MNEMNEDFILSVMEKFNASSAVYLKLPSGEASLCLKKEGAFKVSAPAAVPSVPVPHAAPAEAPAAPPPAPAPEGVKRTQDADPSVLVIESPIVGTFYRAPSPDSPPYVEEGVQVKKGQPLCIIEAMKMMNNLEAEYPCVIEKILVSSGDMVQFGQPLFQVRAI